MSNAIVVLNAGSSSLKFSLHEIVEGELRPVAHGQIEGLGSSPRFKVKDAAGATLAEAAIPQTGEVFGHHESFRHLVAWLREKYAGRLVPVAIGHRVAHGGSEFIKPTLITPHVLEKLEELVPLVPLHQPHNLAAIRGVSSHRPDMPQVACFDTAFHQGRERVTERFGLPDALFKKGIRRWGFHGLSYESVAGTFRKLAPALAEGRVIAAHLGSGASLCAMRNGRSIETTMSFSSLDGIPMGTRCGCLDPGVLLFLLNEMKPDEIESMLYKQSGLLGISGVSNDVRELLASKEPLAAEALDYFVYKISREIASLAAALEGVDAIIFTAGVGENCAVLRRRICAPLAFLGVRLDEAANEANERQISPTGSQPSVWVIPTDEEAVIAAHTRDVLQANAELPK